MKTIVLKEKWGHFEKDSVIEVDDNRATSLIDSEKAIEATDKGLKKSKKKRDGERSGI